MTARSAVDTARITEILRNAQHQDKNIRFAAEGKLKQLQELDFPNFLLSLSAVLSSESNECPPKCRRLAGIILKNSLDERFSADGDLLVNQWINLDQLVKSEIKESLLTTLGSSVSDAWHASSQVIAKVAYVEIPRREWRDLIGKLLDNMAQQGASPLKQATLEALGYVFQDIPELYPDEVNTLDPDEVNTVLNAVVQAMNQSERSFEVRLAAVKALQNVLKHANFANTDCRNLIMNAIRDIITESYGGSFRSSTSAEPDNAKNAAKKMKHEAFGCLVVIASKYYTMLGPYMEAIFSLSTEALKGDVESGALQCIEFWITICEKVIELREQNMHDDILTFGCSSFLSSLVPVLLETLLKQEGYDNAESISISGTTCLGFVARTIGDAILPLAMQFVNNNIRAFDWQSRKAATSALGVLLEGLSVAKVPPVVGLLLDRMEDQNMQVRYAAVSTLRRVFELLHHPTCEDRVFTYANLPRIVAVLAKRSKDVPEVSEEACAAIFFLAKGHSEKEISSELSPFLSNIFDVLFSTSALAKETPFRIPPSEAAYKALREVVRVSNLQDYNASAAIGVLLPRIMKRLNTVLDAKASLSSDMTNKYNHLVLVCDVLHVIIQKLGNSIAMWRTPYVLLLLCRVLTCECSTACDKAALAIGALADATGPNFADHMPILVQYFNVKRLFPTYLQVIGHIFRNLGEKILKHCDSIMDVLYKGLSTSMLKSLIFECFGVIALAIGKHFEKYLQPVTEKMKEAADPRYYTNVFDEKKVEYGNQLRHGILNAYSGILKGIKDPDSLFKLAPDLIKFTEAVGKDQRRSAIVASAAVDVLSELVLKLLSVPRGLIPEVKK